MANSDDLFARAVALVEQHSSAPDGVAACAGLYLDSDGSARTAVSGSGRPEQETVFSAASISKLFVGVAVLQCCEAGLMALDGDVGRCLPERVRSLVRNPHYADEPITVAMLLQHTSSLCDDERALRPGSPYRSDGAGARPPLSLVDYVAARLGGADAPWSKTRRPGSRVHYSNAGFAVLGLAVETARGGRPFASVVREHVFAPLGMTRSSFLLSEALTPDVVVMPPQPGGYYELAEYPAAQLRSTATDLLAFLRTFTERGRAASPILSPASVRRMLPDEGQALAWWGAGFPYHSGGGAWEHGGFMQGVRSYCFVWRSGAFVVMHNGESSIDGDAAALIRSAAL